METHPGGHPSYTYSPGCSHIRQNSGDVEKTLPCAGMGQTSWDSVLGVPVDLSWVGSVGEEERRATSDTPHQHEGSSVRARPCQPVITERTIT